MTGSGAFYDEKSIFLNGPHGFAFYWHDVHFQHKMSSQRQQGAQAIMVWDYLECVGLWNMGVICDNMESVM